MKIIICLLFIFINCYKPISFYDSGPIDKKQCNNADYGIDKIEGQIKYLSIFQYFQTQYQADFDYYKLFYQQQLSLNDSLKKLSMNYPYIKLEFPSQRIKDNISPHDSSIEEAYKQLWEIKKFMDLKMWGYQLQNQVMDLINLDSYQEKDVQIAFKRYEKKKIEQKLQNLKRDFQICSGRDFKVDLIQLNYKNLAQEQNQSTTLPPFQIQISLQTTNYERYELDDFKQKINIDDCPQKIPIIQRLYLEFKKLNTLKKFKSSYEKEFIVNQNFLNQYEQFIIDALPIKERIQRFEIDEQMILKYDKLNNLLNDQQVLEIYEIESVYFGINSQTLYELFDNRIQIFSQIKNYKQLLDKSLPYFSLNKQQLQEIQQTYDSLILFIKKFGYQQDYIKKGIQDFERDLEICKSKFDIYDQTQNHQQNTIQNQGKQQDFKIETQKDEFCYQLYLEMKPFQECPEQREQLDEFNSDEFPQLQYEAILKKIIKNKQNVFKPIEYLKKFKQIFPTPEQLQQLYLVQLYPTHGDPDDIQAVEAYDNLLKLQNIIVFLQNAFIKANDLLNYDLEIIQSYLVEIENLKIKQKERGSKFNNELILFKNCDKTFGFFRPYIEKTMYQEQEEQYEKKYNLGKKLKSNGSETNFILKNPQNLLTIPIIVEQFEIKDIPNYGKSSQQCKADLQGIVEDIIETLKIIELLEYKQFGQNQFDKIISEALKFKKVFLEQVKKLYFQRFSFESFSEIPYYFKKLGNCQERKIKQLYNLLQQINDNIGYLFFAYDNSIDLLKFNDQDFNQLEETQKLVNDYLRDFQKYQLTDMQDQLQELYHEYKVCTGHEFLDDFCQFYEDQNIYGGICQQNCRYEPNKKLNIIHQDTILQNRKKHEISQKLHLQKTKHSKKKQKKKN